MQVIENNEIIFPLRCKKCLEGKHYLSYKCTNCNLSKFEGFK